MIKSFTDYLSLSDFDHSAKSCREIVCFLHLFLHLCKKTRIFRLFYALIRTVCGSCQIVSDLSVQAFCLLVWRWNELLWNWYVLYTFLIYAAEILKTVWVQAHVGSNPTVSAKAQNGYSDEYPFLRCDEIRGIRNITIDERNDIRSKSDIGGLECSTQKLSRALYPDDIITLSEGVIP